MSIQLERPPIDWTKIIERLVSGGIIIASIVYGTGERRARQYHEGEVDSCRGYYYEGRSARYYDGAYAQTEREHREED